jgi:prevent-host-death family protein
VAQVNIHVAKTHLSRLVERAAQGEVIIIAKSGKPMAKLVPIGRDATPRTFGTMRGMIQVPDDFDEPLPPDLVAAFHGEE